MIWLQYLFYGNHYSLPIETWLTLTVGTFRQLASGADTLKFISQQLEFIDRITDVHVPEDDT